MDLRRPQEDTYWLLDRNWFIGVHIENIINTTECPQRNGPQRVLTWLFLSSLVVFFILRNKASLPAMDILPVDSPLRRRCGSCWPFEQWLFAPGPGSLVRFCRWRCCCPSRNPDRWSWCSGPSHSNPYRLPPSCCFARTWKQSGCFQWRWRHIWRLLQEFM